MSNTILVLQSLSSMLEVVAPLRAAGWDVRRSIEVGERGSTQAFPECHVGLIVLDPPDLFSARELDGLAALGPTEWIAILARESLRAPGMARAIVDSCCDFHTLPIDMDRLRVILGHALGRSHIVRELEQNPLDVEGRYGMVGRSPAMLELYRNMEKIFRAKAPLLIRGESGTGKEMVARAVHDNSTRRDGPFVAVNCGALPTHLIQSELFGHEKGSFTGAYQRHIGSIESAQGGTIFLDEIGDLPLELQGNLLRFLQEKTIVRVGATRPVEVDVRVIAATHVDLEAAVAGGGLREDLYYRLNALELCVPALRERGQDIELLAKSRFRQFRRPADHRVRGFSTSAIDALLIHRWKGNVRELINRVEKAIVMSENRLITPTDLGLTIRTLSRGEPSLRSARATTDAGLIRDGLLRNHGNVAKTARELEVSRVTLYRLIDKFGIEHR